MKKILVASLFFMFAVPFSCFGTMWDYSISGTNYYSGSAISGSVTISDQIYSYGGGPTTAEELLNSEYWAFYYQVDSWSLESGDLISAGTSGRLMETYQPGYDFQFSQGVGDIFSWGGYFNVFLHEDGSYCLPEEYFSLPDIIELQGVPYAYGPEMNPIEFGAGLVYLTRQNNPVPEPSTILLLGSGLAGLTWYRRKRKGE